MDLGGFDIDAESEWGPLSSGLNTTCCWGINCCNDPRRGNSVGVLLDEEFPYNMAHGGC